MPELASVTTSDSAARARRRSHETVTIPLSSVLRRNASSRVGRDRRIDSASRAVYVTTTTDKVEVLYEYLVYAVGSVAAAQIPGADQHGFLIGDYDGASSASSAASVRAAVGTRSGRP